MTTAELELANEEGELLGLWEQPRSRTGRLATGLMALNLKLHNCTTYLSGDD